MAMFVRPTTWKGVRSGNGKLPQPSLRGKMQICALLRDNPNPLTEINRIMQAECQRVVKHPGQLMGYMRTIEKLIKNGDPEAIDLGIEFGFCRE
jgi:hypothetical protein